MRLGKATHTAVLEPQRFAAEYVVWEAARNSNAWKAFKFEHEARGKTILTARQQETALLVAKAVRGHKLAGALLAEPGKAELSISWTHKRTGFQCKARIDWLCSALVDLKTTADPSPRLFSGTAARFGIHAQLAFYSAALAAVGLSAPAKLIVAQSVEPYDVCVYSVSDEVLIHGEQRYETALDQLAECRRTGRWPGLAPDEEIPLHLPSWAMPDYEDGDEAVTVTEGAA